MSKDTPEPRAESDESAAPAAERKAKKAKQAKKAKGKKGASGGLTIAAHPRAGASVRRAKGWGGLAGFGIAAYLSWGAGIPMEQVLLRAVAVGIASYMVAWACAVTIWRNLMLAELRALSEQREAATAAAAAANAGNVIGGADDSPRPAPVR